MSMTKRKPSTVDETLSERFMTRLSSAEALLAEAARAQTAPVEHAQPMTAAA